MPYLITTRTPPTTGSMACCHSSIAAGQCGHMLEQDRRAVATLDEARAAARTDAGDYGATGPDDPIMGEIMDLPDHGGTVGPLPDGTVIEVEHVEWEDLTDDKHAALAARNLAGRWETEILDAYNAR